MYKAKLWDEDKWNIHSGSYGTSKYSFSSDKRDEKAYNEQKYGAKEKGVSSDYIKKEEKAGEEKENANIFEDLGEEKANQEVKEEEIPFRAAKQVFAESRQNMADKITSKKKEIKTIDEAIKKAIEEEKKVIIMDS